MRMSKQEAKDLQEVINLVENLIHTADIDAEEINEYYGGHAIARLQKALNERMIVEYVASMDREDRKNGTVWTNRAEWIAGAYEALEQS